MSFSPYNVSRKKKKKILSFKSQKQTRVKASHLIVALSFSPLSDFQSDNFVGESDCGFNQWQSQPRKGNLRRRRTGPPACTVTLNTQLEGGIGKGNCRSYTNLAKFNTEADESLLANGALGTCYFFNNIYCLFRLHFCIYSHGYIQTMYCHPKYFCCDFNF